MRQVQVGDATPTVKLLYVRVHARACVRAIVGVFNLHCASPVALRLLDSVYFCQVVAYTWTGCAFHEVCFKLHVNNCNFV